MKSTIAIYIATIAISATFVLYACKDQKAAENTGQASGQPHAQVAGQANRDNPDQNTGAHADQPPKEAKKKARTAQEPGDIEVKY